MMGVNSLPITVTRQHRGCDVNPGPSAPESSMLTTRLQLMQPDSCNNLDFSTVQIDYLLNYATDVPLHYKAFLSLKQH